MAKKKGGPKIGFAACVRKVMAGNPKYTRAQAEATCAKSGRKKYGKKKFAQMAAASRKKKSGKK